MPAWLCRELGQFYWIRAKISANWRPRPHKIAVKGEPRVDPEELHKKMVRGAERKDNREPEETPQAPSKMGESDDMEKTATLPLAWCLLLIDVLLRTLARHVFGRPEISRVEMGVVCGGGLCRRSVEAGAPLEGTAQKGQTHRADSTGTALWSHATVTCQCSVMERNPRHNPLHSTAAAAVFDHKEGYEASFGTYETQ